VINSIDVWTEPWLKRFPALRKGTGEGALKALKRADERAKALLSSVFGEANNFDDILGGVNVMAVGSNGKRVIVNLFEALTPIFEDGAKRCASAKLEAAKAARGDRRSPVME